MAYMKDATGRRLDTFEVVPAPVITGFSPPLVAGVSTSSHPTVLGTSAPHSLVTLYLNGSQVGIGFSDAAGEWAIALPAQLNGAFNLIARATPASELVSMVINDPKQPLENVQGIPAVFDMDTERGLFYTNGTVYADQGSLIGALGGASSGSAFSFGGYVDPAATNLITNGTFDTTTTGWAPGGSAVLASVAGEMELTCSGAADSFVQALTGYAGRGIQFTGRGRRGTHVSNVPGLSITLQNAVFGGNSSQAGGIVATNTDYKLFSSAAPSGSLWMGVKSGPGSGTSYWDNFAACEAMPCQGWTPFASTSSATPPSFSAVIVGTAPASLPAAGQVKYIWQADANSMFNGVTSASQHNCIRLVWTETGDVQLIKRLNNTTSFTLTLGNLAPGADFRVALGASAGANGDSQSGYAGSLNGLNAVVQATTVDTMVGVTHVRVGQNADGTQVFDGTLKRVAVVRGRQTNDWLEFQATLPTALPRLFAGDSYIGGAGGVVLPNIYETATGKVTYNIGVGGSTFASQVGHITSRPYLRDVPTVVWDGSNNGMVDVVSQVALARQIWDWKANGRLLFLPSIAVPNPGTASSPTPTASATLLRQYRDALVAAFGAAHVYDPVPVLQALSTGSADDLNDVAAGLVPRSVLITQNAGEVHLGTAAMTAIANDPTFRSKVDAL